MWMDGVSQQDVAERMGTSQSHISEIMSGQVDVRVGTLERLVKALGGTLRVEVDMPRAADTGGVAADHRDGDLGDAIAEHDERLHDDPAVGVLHTLVAALDLHCPYDTNVSVARDVISYLAGRGYVIRTSRAENSDETGDSPATSASESTDPNGPGGSHYGPGVQPVDLIDALGLGFYEGQVIKYVARWEHKPRYDGDPLIDLRKALWYLERLLRLAEQAEHARDEL
jgi:transcriptional regulator with XRE-family HTH domain